ncbi:MAG: Glu-tRNA(Gln) amidotransferase GatDE subunit D [Candidatus Hydrothermarchaeota archaeon]|nr:MAG: Glu-tRNA(Gln) amidotransferase GatDE subunit D [Candidatus Hydrothermarchaeota archaeon]
MYRGKAREFLKGISIGDRVRITKEGRSYEGFLMPRSELGDEKHVVIKLDNGYNIGINIKNATIERIPYERARAKIEERKVSFSKEKPTVTILGTGGTIASKIDYKTGAVHPSFSTEELVNAIPELEDIANIRTNLLFNILSENMTPTHWKEIAKAIAKELNSGVSGIVVAHGTDTLAYTSAALSFMLKNLYKPVVLVGAQRSSDRPSSDASMNLVSSVRVACSDIGEVVVIMHGSTSDDYCLIHRGVKVRKMHSSRRDAFRSINAKPIGEIRENKIKVFQKYRKRKEEEVFVDDKLEEKVALIKIYPGIDKEYFDYVVDNYKGIVIEGTGLGHVPTNLLPSIERAYEEGIPVVMTTQTIYGRVNMNVYSTGRELLARGVIPGEDMLPEVAYVKLMHVLAHFSDLEEIKREMLRNIAGEITERTEVDNFLI